MSEKTVLSFAEMIGKTGGNDAGKSITERSVSYASKKSAFISAAFAASSDNFSRFFDIKRTELKTLSDMEVQREAAASVARLNAAARKAGLDVEFGM